MAYTTAQLLGALLTIDGRAVQGGAVELPPNARILLDLLVEGTAEGSPLTDMVELRAQAQALVDQQVDLSNIAIDDDVVEALLKGTAGAGPKTRAELTATFETLAGAATRYAPIARVLECKPFWAAGHSWIDGGHVALWWNRVVARLHMNSMAVSGFLGGYSGRTVCDVALAHLSNPATSGDIRPVWVARTEALAALVCTINDVTVWDGSAAAKVGYKHAWKALLSIITDDVAVSSDTESFVYSTNWSAITVPRSIVQGATTNATGTRQWTTTTVGSYFELTATGDAVDVFLMARAAGAGLCTFTIGGSTVGTLDLTAATAQDTIAVAKLTGLGAGTHLIRGTLTSGASLTVDSYRVPLAQPTQGIVLGEPEVIPTGEDEPTYLADVTAFKVELATIVAGFPSFTYLDLAAEPGWSTATMLTSDGKHPNDRGAAWIADRFVVEALTLTYSDGLNVTGTAAPAAYVIPSPPAIPAGGTFGGVLMYDTSPYTGTTDLGGYTWANVSDANHEYRTVDVTRADVIVRATLTAITAFEPTSSQAAHGVATRVSDVSNGIHLDVTPTKYRFSRYLTGTHSVLNSYGTSGALIAGAAPAIGDKIEVRTKANVVECWINGVKRMEHTNLTQNQTTTKHGLVESSNTTATTFSGVYVIAN